MTGAFRIFIADNADRQFVRAGIEAACNNPRLDMMNAVPAVNLIQRCGRGSAVNQAFDDAAIRPHPINDPDG